jgi:hypothetical protein
MQTQRPASAISRLKTLWKWQVLLLHCPWDAPDAAGSRSDKPYTFMHAASDSAVGPKSIARTCHCTVLTEQPVMPDIVRLLICNVRVLTCIVQLLICLTKTHTPSSFHLACIPCSHDI